MFNTPVLTCHRGDNASLIAEVARLYFKPGMRIADVTFGQGIWWRRIDLSQYDFCPSDLLTVPDHLYDCRCLPYRSGDFDVHVLDLPYIHGMRGGGGRVHGADYKTETIHRFTYADILQLL